MPRVVILGKAERVSVNLSDAQCYLKKKKMKERDGERERREIGAGRGKNKRKNSRHNLHKHGFSKFHLSMELLSNMTMPTRYVYFSLLEGFLAKCYNTSLESGC